MTDTTALAGMARAQGAMGALQSAVGAIVTNAAEAEERALIAEARVTELERSPDRAMNDPRSTLSVVA